MNSDSEKQTTAENDSNNQESGESTEIEKLKKAMAEEKAKSEANLAGWQRAQADYINLKRQSEQEKSDICKFANRDLVLNLLPVIDDFDRVIANIPHSEAKHKWVEGLRLLNKKQHDTLQKLGIVGIQSMGEEFDPGCMDAISCGKGKKDRVIMELEKGYKMFDKVIRPAKVVVGNDEEEANKEE
jgi:molecular chaperone GrpE